MRWTFYVRSAAALVLVACLFLPFSTCTQRGKTTVHVPIRNMEPLLLVLAVFCWPVLILTAEAFLPRFAMPLLWLQPILAAASLYQAWVWVLLETPQIGSYLTDCALGAIFVFAVTELVVRLRARRRERKAALAVASTD